MPIEFRCSHCGKLLRTGDDTAGRQAQCPECGTISTVPAPAGPTAAPTPSMTTLESSSPFASQPAAENLDLLAAQKISGPAIALIITGLLSILAHLGLAGFYAVVIYMALNGQVPVNQGFPQQDPAQVALGGGVIVAGAIIRALLDIVVLIGAVKMKNLRSYPFAMAAAIIAVIPCSLCCVLGLPFGIWAIMVLSDGSVKSAFRS
jgi:phage FluMu protein Com